MNRRYRKTIIAGNWKMNMSVAECRSFIADIKPLTARAKWCEVVLCVPFTMLPAAIKAAKGAHIEIGAQNCHWAESGAYTGDVSCRMLTELGVRYVIIGHSERRQMAGETDEQVNRKVKAALEAGLRPILCVGEPLEIRENGATIDYVNLQVKAAIHDLKSDQIRKVTIAYEPIWAIGTGKTATADQADEVGAEIRRTLRGIYGARVARSVSLLYGGSMNEKNAADLLSRPDVDGGLIGGASLKTESFSHIINAADQEL